MSFSYQLQLVVFQWSLNGCKFPLLSRALLAIIVDFNSTVVWIVSIFLSSPVLSVSFPGFLRPFQEFQQQLVSPSLSYSTAFSALWRGIAIYPAFCFLLFSLNDLVEQQSL